MIFPKQEFQKASVKEANLDKGLLADMFDEIEKQKMNIHSMVLLKDGARVFRASAFDYTEDTKENVYSISKSFTSIAIGILIDLNLVNLEDYVLFFFSNEVESYLPAYEKLKVKHLLTMSSGQSEDIFNRLTPSDNIYQEFFNVPLSFEIGKKFQYHNASTLMLSAIVTKVTGKCVNDFLEAYLYKHIGIEKPEWDQVNNINFGATGLRISTNDMARFGLLLLNDGNWDGKQIVSKAYLDEATKFQINTEESDLDIDKVGYGYQFWINSFGNYRCAGMFKQYIVINKEFNLVFACKAYEEREVLDLFDTFILESAKKGWHYVSWSLRDYIRDFKNNSRELIENEREKRIY